MHTYAAMQCKLCIYLGPYEYYVLLTGPHYCCCVVWASAAIAAVWLRHRTDYCTFLLRRRKPHGVPSPCSHGFMVCCCLSKSYAIVFRYTLRCYVLTIGHSFKTNSGRTIVVKRIE